MIICYLTCANDDEAQTIGRALLEAKLIACVRRMPIQSSYWWGGKINDDNEVLLMIESREDKFDAINQLVGKLHSYKDYVLTAVPVSQTTPGVLGWIDETLGKS